MSKRILIPRRPRIEVLPTPGKSVLVPRRVQHLAVRFETAICDAAGRVERILQRGVNTITDWGMDQLSSSRLGDLLTTLHLSDTTATSKRVAGGEELTIDYSAGPDDIDITTDTNFFEAGDVGRTLKIAGFPELLIDGFTSAQAVHAHARGDLWLPGFDPDTPGTGPHTDFGVHYTDDPTLANQFTKYGTFDSGSADNNATLNDSANSRFNLQRIWLSGAVTGSAWTVNQVGWSDNNGSNNCFGIANLGSPDVIPVGKKYRLKLNVFDAYTPIDITGLAVDWGGDIGSYTFNVRQERIYGIDSNTNALNFLRPFLSLASNSRTYYVTGTMTLGSIAWEGDAGFTSLTRTKTDSGVQTITDAAYTGGNHNRTRRLLWPDTISFSGANGLQASSTNAPYHNNPIIAFKPQTGTVTKPSGFWCDLTWRIHWTRELLN